MGAAWIEQVKARADVVSVAAHLGLSRGRLRSFGPCPSCRAARRGASDQRLPLGENGRAWHCWACNVGGDALDLVALVRAGRRAADLSPDEWRTVREACAAAGWCDPDSPHRTSVSAATASTRVTGAAGGRRIVHVGAALRGDRARAHGAPVPEPTDDPPAERGGPFAWRDGLADECEARLWSPDGARALAYLRDVRRFSDETIRAWRLGAHVVERDGRVVEWYVAIPVLDAREDVINVRFRSVPGPCGYCGGASCGRCKGGQVGKSYRQCAGRPLGLYGAHRLPYDLAAVPIVVEGELDVVALHEYGYPSGVVSGTGGAKTLKDEWLDTLEPYAGFVVAYDADDAGNEGAAALVERLGRYRCSRATFPRKDAGDCLADGVPVEQIAAAIQRAAPCVGVDLVRADVFADEIETLVNSPETLRGRPTGCQKLDRVLGGVRPGLVVLTGETGQGKTTFATWLLYEQARAGVPCLLTSFEQSPVGTTQKLLRAQIGGDFTASTPIERRAALDALAALPLWVVRHRGHLAYADLVDTIRYAVRRLDVRAVLIDHLGFVTDPDAEDERREIQAVVRALSIFAEHEGVTVILVCHPSNMHVAQKRRVTLADLKGASAIRQDAHEVWVVEAAPVTTKRSWPASWVHLDKVRSDFGASGSSVLLAFDPLACTYADGWGETPSGRRGVRLTVPTPSATGPSKRKGKGEAAGDTDDAE